MDSTWAQTACRDYCIAALVQEYTGIPAHTLVHGQSLYKAAEAKPALKTGNKIKPEDQQTLLSITWILFFLFPVPSFLASCFPSPCVLVFHELTFFPLTLTSHRLLFFAHVPSGWRSSSAGWASTTRSRGSSSIGRWPPWGAASASATPWSSSSRRPKTWPRRRPTSCACPPWTWRWHARARMRVSVRWS